MKDFNYLCYLDVRNDKKRKHIFDKFITARVHMFICSIKAVTEKIVLQSSNISKHVLINLTYYMYMKRCKQTVENTEFQLWNFKLNALVRQASGL